MVLFPKLKLLKHPVEPLITRPVALRTARQWWYSQNCGIGSHIEPTNVENEKTKFISGIENECILQHPVLFKTTQSVK